MLEKTKAVSSNSGGISMSEKYLIVSEPEQVPPYDPKAIAQGLGMALLGFLGPLVLELDRSLDKRLIRTVVRAVETTQQAVAYREMAGGSHRALSVVSVRPGDMGPGPKP